MTTILLIALPFSKRFSAGAVIEKRTISRDSRLGNENQNQSEVFHQTARKFLFFTLLKPKVMDRRHLNVAPPIQTRETL